ncbi:metalloprotease [Mycobacterium sp. CBMA271]|uniref:neutral zinc metallopeptidase n=1 Tax=unclassified Mycobacteroides TaxID=2618759 RepID=UPI0012DCE4C3|nr:MULTISPECIES: neutral zinc metallopeptidase [unclassified Mycobacteroides]MUM18374.1 metalloprotease [Mycobacteroides sp. CBMA 326]MUM23644.1 metalloprotease [Mycobacteroides sp. CBMA 271]
MQPQQPYGQPRPVPGWNAPLPGPAPMPMAPPRGWRPPPGPPRPGYPAAPLPPGYPVPSARPVYPPPAAYGYRRPPPLWPNVAQSGGGNGTGAIIGAVAFGLVVVSIVGVLITWAVTGRDSARTTTTRAQTTSYRYPLTSSSRTATSSPTTSRTTYTTTTVWTPPPPPRSEPVLELGQHPLFWDKDSGFTNAPCSTSSWPYNVEQADVFYRDLRTCMDPEWRRLLEAKNLPWSSPNIVVIGGNWTDSPCGGWDFWPNGSAGFYCPGNQTIYMSIVALSPGKYGNHDGPYAAAFAHEYAHHGQELSGIWSAYWNERRRAGADSPQGLEFSRRAELQAQCFSGMFLGSRRGGTITEDEYQRAGADQYRGDGGGGKRDHGTYQHGYNWWWHGAVKNRNWECNTWLADSSEVS